MPSACPHRPEPCRVHRASLHERTGLSLLILYPNMCKSPSGHIEGGSPAKLVPDKQYVSIQLFARRAVAGGALPAGSLRCERFVRSSLASSIVGFINGGSDGSLPDWRASSETSNVLVCRRDQGQPSYGATREETPFPCGDVVRNAGKLILPRHFPAQRRARLLSPLPSS